MREVKLPPMIRFMVINAISSGLLVGGATCPAKINDCWDPGPVHEVDLGTGVVVHSPDLLLRNRSALPVLEDPLQLRLDLSQGGVAHHDQGGVVGAVPGGVKILELVPGDGFCRLHESGPGQRVPVSMVRSIDELGHHPQGHGDRTDLLPVGSGPGAGSGAAPAPSRERRGSRPRRA